MNIIVFLSLAKTVFTLNADLVATDPAETIINQDLERNVLSTDDETPPTPPPPY